MSKWWLEVATSVLDSVDSDTDIFTGGLRAAQKGYYEVKQVLHRITFVIMLICLICILGKYFLF